MFSTDAIYADGDYNVIHDFTDIGATYSGEFSSPPPNKYSFGLLKLFNNQTNFILLGANPNNYVLHAFMTNDGYSPSQTIPLVGDDDAQLLYGVSRLGATNFIFKMGQDGSNYTNYLNCSTFFPFYNCPIISLTLANNTFYGIAGWLDGKARDLSVFKVNTDGTGYADLHDFTNGFPSFGSIPMIYLRGFAGGNTNVLYDVLYGMETAGDGGQNGAIFALPVATNLISNCNPPVLSSGQASGSTFLV